MKSTIYEAKQIALGERTVEIIELNQGTELKTAINNTY